MQNIQDLKPLKNIHRNRTLLFEVASITFWPVEGIAEVSGFFYEDLHQVTAQNLEQWELVKGMLLSLHYGCNYTFGK